MDWKLSLAGLLIGDALSGGGPGRGPRPAELALGPLARALDPEDRRAILQDLRGDPGLGPLGREERAADLAGMAAALRTEPFDEAAAGAALAAGAERLASAEAAVREALIARLAAMPPEARRAVADRIESERGRP